MGFVKFDAAPADGYGLVSQSENELPAKATGLWRWLLLITVLFFAFFPLLLAASWQVSPCSDGSPLVLYAPPLLMMLVVTAGEAYILRRLRVSGSGKMWDVAKEAYDAVYNQGFLVAKMDHWIIVSISGRMEFLDETTNALQPGQARACEKGKDTPLGFAGLDLPEIFMIVSSLSFFLQSAMCSAHLWHARNVSNLELRAEGSTDTSYTNLDAADTFMENKSIYDPLRESYPSSSAVADLLGAPALSSMLSKTAGILHVKSTEFEDYYKGLTEGQTDGAAGETLEAKYEAGNAPIIAMIEEAEAAAAAARAEGDDDEVEMQEEMIKDLKESLESVKATQEECRDFTQTALGTTNLTDIGNLAIKAQKDIETQFVEFKVCLLKVPCDAAPQLVLLSLLFSANFKDLAWKGKAQIVLSFILSLKTCLNKNRTLWMLGKAHFLYPELDKKMMGLLGIFSALAVVVLSVISVVKFVGAFYCQETHVVSLVGMQCVE